MTAREYLEQLSAWSNCDYLNGKGPREDPDIARRMEEIAELCRFRYDFQTDNLARAARSLSAAGLREALRLCAEADAALKSSRGEPYDLLTDLVLALYRALGMKEDAA